MASRDTGQDFKEQDEANKSYVVPKGDTTEMREFHKEKPANGNDHTPPETGDSLIHKGTHSEREEDDGQHKEDPLETEGAVVSHKGTHSETEGDGGQHKEDSPQIKGAVVSHNIDPMPTEGDVVPPTVALSEAKGGVEAHKGDTSETKDVVVVGDPTESGNVEQHHGAGRGPDQASCVNAMKEEIRKLEEEIEIRDKKHEEMAMTLEEKKADIKSYKVVIDKHEATIRDNEEILNEFEARMKKLNDDVTQKDATITELQERARKEGVLNVEICKNIIKAADRNNKMESEHLKNKMKEIEDKAKNLESRNDNQMKRIKDLHEKLKTVKTEKENVEKKYTDLKKSAAKEKENADKNIKELEKRTKKEKEDLTKHWSKRFEDIEKERNKLQKDVDSLTKENTEVKSNLYQYADGYKRATTEVSRLTAENMDLKWYKNMYPQLKQDIQTLRKTKHSLEEEKDTLLLRVKKEKENVEKKYADLEKSAAKETENTAKYIKGLEKRLQKDVDSLPKKNTEVESNLRQYIDGYTWATTEVSRLTAENMDLKWYKNMYPQLKQDIQTLRNTKHSLEEEKDTLLLRLSKIAGANLPYNNPNIADLSDEKRPTKLAEEFSELYDNEWTDAFEDVEGSDDESKTRVLYNLLEQAYTFCEQLSIGHDEAIQGSFTILNYIRTLPQTQDETVEQQADRMTDESNAPVEESNTLLDNDHKPMTKDENPASEVQTESEVEPESDENTNAEPEVEAKTTDPVVNANAGQGAAGNVNTKPEADKSADLSVDSESGTGENVVVASKTGENVDAELVTGDSIVVESGAGLKEPEPDVSTLTSDKETETDNVTPTETPNDEINQNVRSESKEDDASTVASKDQSCSDKLNVESETDQPRSTTMEIAKVEFRFDELSKEQKKMIMDIKKLCEIKQSPDVTKVGTGIIAEQMKISTEAQEIMTYISKCIEICWSMHRHVPPVYIDFSSYGADEPFDTKMYRAYTKSGKRIHFVVWPAIHLHKGGPLLAKGVAKGRN